MSKVHQPVLYLCRRSDLHERCQRDADRNGFTLRCVTGSALAAQAFLRQSQGVLPLVFLIPGESADDDVAHWSELIKREIRPRKALVTVICVE